MDQSEVYDLNEALARVYAEQRKLEESPPPEGASRVAWAAFCAKRAGLALERRVLERFSSMQEPLQPAQVAGAGSMAAREELSTEALGQALGHARVLPGLPWWWGEVRDGDVPRVQWIASHAGAIVEAYGGA
jgi:hypothetical protein